jgi:PAS domain S-box-containing protein
MHCHGWAIRGRDEKRLILLRLTPKQPAVSRFLGLNSRIEQLTKEISLRLRAEQTAHEQRELLQVTLSSIGDAVITGDVAGNVTFMNPVAEAHTGWKAQDALGRPLDEVFVIRNEITGEPVDNPAHKVLRTGHIVALANHTVLIRRDGAELPIDDSGAPIRDSTGELIGVVLVFHEIGERRKLERELRRQADALRQADKRKDDFLAMLAHELRNPLAPLYNCVQLLRARTAAPVDIDALADMMERQTGQLRRLVDDLLDISRITRGVIKLEKRPIALAEIIEHAIETVEPLVQERQHTLEVSLPDDSVVVNADLTRL